MRAVETARSCGDTAINHFTLEMLLSAGFQQNERLATFRCKIQASNRSLRSRLCKRLKIASADSEPRPQGAVSSILRRKVASDRPTNSPCLESPGPANGRSKTYPTAAGQCSTTFGIYSHVGHVLRPASDSRHRLLRPVLPAARGLKAIGRRCRTRLGCCAGACCWGKWGRWRSQPCRYCRTHHNRRHRRPGCHRW